MQTLSQSFLSARVVAGGGLHDEKCSIGWRASLQIVLDNSLIIRGSSRSEVCLRACFLRCQRRGAPRLYMGMHPEWRQVDNKIRRLEHRIADFRIMTNDLRIQRNKIGLEDHEIDQTKLLEYIRKREAEVVAEREALQKEMEQLTMYFHKGAEPEYKGVRRFFLSYLYHTCRKAFENFPDDEFDRVLAESPGGISFEWPERGTVFFPLELCKKILIGKKISISSAGLDTSPLAVALAVLQAGAEKHCENPLCRREECHILKQDYEQLFEAFFKCKIRTLINQKSRGEMSIQFDRNLKVERLTGVKVS
ncbi:hypothetical protein KP509_16G020500 [Ceratopteris richardii]|uniref:Uncharacterized protein n=1 Tax=Ceratopteris richardii TaxID=49495 RepID=A0A8T2T2R8_CERRI|nr:hypothetical protein KP509_16G020500 [Ceratopteris richardii]